MLRVAIKGVLARKLRLLLTSIAVVLGVGFVSGAFFLTDSLRNSFDTLFTEAASGIDVYVQTNEYKELIEEQATSQPGTVSIDIARVGVAQEAVEQARGVAGVRNAVGSVFEVGVQALDKKGKPLGGSGAPTFAANWEPEAADVGALKLSQGKAPRPGEVMLDATTMDRGKFQIGDTVKLLIQGGRSAGEFVISGIVTFGESNSLNGATIVVFDTNEVQKLLDMGGRFSALAIEAEDGVSQATLKGRVAQRLGGQYSVITGKEFIDDQAESIDTAFLDILQSVILGFAAVAVFVGAFTIFNTFTILVGQRTREFGLLRAIGASRRQILGIVILEAIVLGIIASSIGIVTGYGVAGLLRELLNQVADGGIPEAAFPLRSRTIIAGYAVGVIVTLVASIVPALRASRLSPLEALQTNPASAGRGWKTPVIGALLIAAGATLMFLGFSAPESWSATQTLSFIGFGLAVGIIGLAAVSRILIAPVTHVLSSALGRGATGRLATRNVLRNRARSASTAAALMIGLAIASLALVFYSSLQRTVDQQIEEILSADITIFNTTALNTGIGVVSEEIIDTVRNTAGVDEAVGQRIGGASRGERYDPAKVKTLVAFDEGALGGDGLVAIDMRAGSSKPGNGVLIDSDLAKEDKLSVGDKLRLAFPTNEQRTLTIAGVFEPNQFIGSQLVVEVSTFNELQPPQVQASSTAYVSVKEGEQTGAVIDRIKRALGDDAAFLEIQDSAGLRDRFGEQLAPVLGLVLGMLSLSLVIALFGIANTLALNVFERTREIGLLRAVGATRRQLRRIIRVESVLVALFGAVIGVLVGAGAGYALVTALKAEGFVFAANPVALVGVLFAGFIAGIIASILPARRAARMDVLAAISTE